MIVSSKILSNSMITVQYLDKWIKPFEEYEVFPWLLLKMKPLWVDVQVSVVCLISLIGEILQSNESDLFDEFNVLIKFLTGNKVDEWNNC